MLKRSIIRDLFMFLYFTIIDAQERLITKISQKIEIKNNICLDKFIDTNENIYYEGLHQEDIYLIDLIKHIEKRVEYFYQMQVFKIKGSLKN